MADPFHERERAEAALLDAEVDRLLVGGPQPNGDPVLTWLAAAVRTDPPASLAARIERDSVRREQARWRPVQLVAAVLAALLLAQGIGNLVNGAWVARGLGEPYVPHVFTESGFALLAAGLAVGAGVVRRGWLPVSVTAGVPLGIALGVNGLPEVGEFAAGAVLHLSQGAAALGLAATWWRARRYEPRVADEGEA